MTLNIAKIGEADLLAYVDGQLSPTDHETVERYLAQNPAKAAEIAEWQQQSEAIGALFDHVANEPVPKRLNPHTIAQTRAKTPRAANDNFWRMAAAAMILLAFGSTLGWYGRDAITQQASAPDMLITAAFNAHELFAGQQVHPVEVSADDRLHLASWLSNNLDRRLIVPASLPNGFELVGGRLLPTDSNPAAQLMYEAGPDRRVTLYLTPKTEAEPKQNQFAALDNLDALYWANDALTCTIVGNLTRVEMEEIASEVFKALNWQDEDYRGA